MNIAADMCVYTNHNFIIEQVAPVPSDEAIKESKKLNEL